MYHFTSIEISNTRPVGWWQIYKGRLLCSEEDGVAGLHAHVCPLRAFHFATGPILHKVNLISRFLDGYHYVGHRRQIIASIDARELAHKFARWYALQVIDKWAAPDVVYEYLKTGNEKLRKDSRAESREALKHSKTWGIWKAKRERAWAAVAARSAACPMYGTKAMFFAGRAAAAAIGAGMSEEKQRTKFKEMVDEAFGD
jgi:hypothetical protein